jgi:hypothetical protein
VCVCLDPRLPSPYADTSGTPNDAPGVQFIFRGKF